MAVALIINKDIFISSPPESTDDGSRLWLPMVGQSWDLILPNNDVVP